MSLCFCAHARHFRHLSAISLFLLCAPLASCSSQPPPPPKQINIAAAPTAAPAPETAPLSPSRWLDSGGATLVGPELPQGRLLLLGGRRALLQKDGSVKAESVPCPEALMGLIEVPDEQGKKVLIGHGSKGIYRFDDPLAAAVKVAQSEVNIDHIGAGPNSVAVWDYQSYVPRFIDLKSAKMQSLSGLPALPLRAIAFRNAKEGAAIFEAAGLAVTQDGGATWKPAGDSAQGKDALRATGLRIEHDKVLAFVYSNGPAGEIDIAKASLGAMRDPPAPQSEAHILRWIRVTERDPLEAAAASGVESAPGTAIAASHGLLARIDLNTGAILEMQQFSNGYGLTPCTLTKAGAHAWLGCIVSEQEEGFDFIDPFAVFRLPVSGLSLGKPVFRRSGDAWLRGSPSGGLLLTSPCNAEEDGNLCVQKPGGTWSTMRVPNLNAVSSAGPLADGSVAYLRGLEEGDEPESEDREAAAPENGADGEGADGRRALKPAIYVMDATGKERKRAVLRWNERPSAQLFVQSPIEEDEDHTLRFVLSNDEGEVFSVVQAPGADGVAPQHIPDVNFARLHGGRGLALSERRAMATVDGGLTWNTIDLADHVQRFLSSGSVGYLADEPGVFTVSEVGAKIDTQLRIGWGAPQEMPHIPQSEAKETLPSRPSKPVNGSNVIQCTSTKTAVAGIPPLKGSYEISELFPRPKTAAGAKAKAPTSSFSTAPMGRFGMLDTVASLEELFDKPKEPPKTWNIKWLNSYETGAKAQSVSGPAPKGASTGTLMRMAAGMGKRALFMLRSGGKNWLFRVKAQGGSESIEIDNDRLPTGDIVFGTDASDIIAWSHDNYVVAWPAGEVPRIIANVGGRAQRSLGVPTKEGVPMLLSFNDIALLGNLPMVAVPKPEKGSAEKPPATIKLPPPAPVSLEGWTSVPNVIRRDAPILPLCAPKAKGARFLFNSRLLSLRTDGASATSPEAVYDVLIGAKDSCIQGVSIIFSPPRSIPSFQPGTGPGGPKQADPGPMTFIRADFVNKKAEGGSRGPKGKMVKISCTL